MEKQIKCSFTGVEGKGDTLLIMGPDNVNISDEAVFIALNELIKRNPVKYYGQICLAALKAGQLIIDDEKESEDQTLTIESEEKDD